MFQNRSCLNCGDPLTGRSDKKFCDDQCRASYNNRSRRPHEFRIRETYQKIRRNRTILKSLCPTGKATVRKEILSEMGFEFGLFTSIFRSKANTYYFSHEYGYAPLLESSLAGQQVVKKVLIVQQQPFMDKPFDPWK
jgi:predicted nucleic acid-binding Zn ribbon protein